jgi:hypothetical protein
MIRQLAARLAVHSCGQGMSLEIPRGRRATDRIEADAGASRRRGLQSFRRAD